MKSAGTDHSTNDVRSHLHSISTPLASGQRQDRVVDCSLSSSVRGQSSGDVDIKVAGESIRIGYLFTPMRLG